MFIKQFNKALILALALAIATPAQAWDVRSWFNGISDSTKKIGLIASATAVVAGGIGYLIWKYCELKKLRAEDARDEKEFRQQLKERREASLDSCLIRKQKKLEQIGLAKWKQQANVKKQQEEKRKQNEAFQREQELKAKQAMEIPALRMKQLRTWWDQLSKAHINAIERQLTKIINIVKEGQTIQLSPSFSLSDTTPSMNCDIKDLTLINEWCKNYRKSHPLKPAKSKETFYEQETTTDWAQEPEGHF